MNKEEIYRLIGYHGEYSQSVKRAIRKLLKENHPDQKGDRRIFELINEVKKELEEGKVKYIPKKAENIKDNIDIDYDYCLQRINEITKKRSVERNLLNEKVDELEKEVNKYKKLYRDSLDLERNLLANSPDFKKVKSIKSLSIIVLVIMIVVFTVAIFKNNHFLFIAFLLLSVITIIIIQRYYALIHQITTKNENKFNNYVDLNGEVRENINKQNEIKKEITEIEKRINLIDNDLRFYKNLLK